ncbi:flagellar biosynthesis anti-sigma factor FlgM [Pacificimonas sp. ICDLI1SI03]
MNKLTAPVIAPTRLTGSAAESRAKPAADTPVSTAARPQPASDVDLSATAAQAFSADAPVDRSRIDAIRTAIAEGRYPVDPQAIARSMVAFEFGE